MILRLGHSELVEVLPPAEAPVQELAASMGLIDGLRAQRTDREFCCASCFKMSVQGWQVWVPDRVRREDAPASVTEQCRRRAFNGSFSAWCVSCAQSFAPAAPLRQMGWVDWIARLSNPRLALVIGVAGTMMFVAFAAFVGEVVK